MDYLRIRAQHRDQWRSILKESAYKTTVVSGEYKFSGASARKISVGTFFFQDKAGSLDFRTQGFHLTTSVVQPLGNPYKANHSIAIGCNVGWGTRKIDLENAQWPGPPPTDMDDKTSYPDVSAGVLWQYRSNTHFSWQLGKCIASSQQAQRILFSRQELIIFILVLICMATLRSPWSIVSRWCLHFCIRTRGLLNNWHLDLITGGTLVRQVQILYNLAFLPKPPKIIMNETDINIYVLSATAEINSFLFGFSFDRFEGVESNAYEFSVGYTFGMLGMPGSKDMEGM
jgi:hypothetical protein